VFRKRFVLVKIYSHEKIPGSFFSAPGDGDSICAVQEQ
jgi:hypothetical protein